jgi:hypothetical protein
VGPSPLFTGGPALTLDHAISAALEFNEQKLSKKVPLPPTRLSEEQAIAFELFAVWCRRNGVRSLPVRPSTLAVYLQSGVAGSDPFAVAESVRIAHQIHGLPCPVSTDVVRLQLNNLLDEKPPRSWRADEKLLWCELPPEIRKVIKRREQEDAAAVRRLMCGAAKPATNKEEGTENATDQK